MLIATSALTVNMSGMETVTNRPIAAVTLKTAFPDLASQGLTRWLNLRLKRKLLLVGKGVPSQILPPRRFRNRQGPGSTLSNQHCPVGKPTETLHQAKKLVLMSAGMELAPGPKAIRYPTQHPLAPIWTV
mgnify:CR=1 FL=1